MDITVKQGKTFTRTWRWGADPVVFKQIAGVTLGAPLSFHVPAHGLSDGWVVSIHSLQGTVEANSPHDPPWPSDYVKVHVVDVDNIQIVGVNASDFSAYIAGGVIRYATPVDLTGYTAALVVKDTVGGTVLDTLTDVLGIVIDNSAKTITATFTAADTATYQFTRGVYEMKLINGAYVKQLEEGAFLVEQEVAP